MNTYKTFKPTAFDAPGLCAERLEIGHFLVAPVSQTRDSGPLETSNFATFLTELGGESDTVQVHRFGHWGPGWFEIILIDPNDTKAITKAEAMEARLEDYPVLDEEDWSNREQEEANEIWQKCYNVRERVNYIRQHRSQFEFQDFADMLGCVRGNYFAGYASELID